MRIYSLLLYLLAPVLLLVTLKQAKSRRGGLAFVKQRMGWAGLNSGRAGNKAGTEAAIWLHAASVGEIVAVLPLLQALISRFGSSPITITTNTPESALILQGKFGDRIKHRYCAIDFPGAVQDMFQHINPAVLLVVETEIWPNLYHMAGYNSTPLIIVNARLGHKTLGANALIRKLYQATLGNVEAILARSKKDAQGFRELGVPAGKIQTPGNIKFSATALATANPVAELHGRRYVLAVSTHAPEESLLGKIATALPKDVLMVVVPRHPQRRAEIIRQLQLASCRVAVRSNQDPVTEQTNVYLADTTGEVSALISAATMVYVGGSLAPEIGGHNLLEPAMQGKPVISGPSLHNFTDEADLLLTHDALTIVQDSDALQDTVLQLLNDNLQLQRKGANALAAFAGCTGILEQYLAVLTPTIANSLAQKAHRSRP